HGKTTLLIISHDIQTIQTTCEYVAIMYGGRIIESGPVQEVLCSPRHPYTRLLLSCQQRRRGEPLTTTETETLDLIDFPTGCSFHPGCSLRLPICSKTQPDDYYSGSVKVSCHLFNREAIVC
ncbi:MAG: hypothetical protein NTV30_10020, partial [Chloroflexi bacterium]|nr:hypothetical protein [Chloroflexota bacterium]